MTPENEKQLTDVARKVHHRAADDLLTCIKGMLAQDQPPCGHRHHRTKPEGPNDWRAVDNMMANITQGLLRTTPTLHAALLTQAMVAQEMTQETDADAAAARLTKVLRATVEASEYEALCKAAQFILNAHFDLVTKAVEDQRSNTADLHYDRIIGMAEQTVGELLKQLDAENSDDMQQRWKAMGLAV